MAPVTLSGLSSVSDRTLFTRRAPIVKKPLPLLTGANLFIISPTSVKIVSANFTSGDIGKTLSISGSTGGRNDGVFPIVEVPNSITAVLEGVNFSIVDVSATIAKIISLVNDVKSAFTKHCVHLDSRLPSPFTTHAHNDIVNVVTAPDASDLTTSITLLNQIRTLFLNHMANIGGDFHTHVDQWNPIVSVAASSFASAETLANELRTKFESHRLERRSHLLGDADSRVTVPLVVSTIQSSGPLVGPFTWTLYDPRRGTVADSPDDVVVRINGTPVDAVAVFGMVGAVILPTKPSVTDSVAIDYDYLNNPPARFLRLNSPEFVLNQDKNNGIMGLPSHKYRARSYLVDPGHTPDLISAVAPLRIGWKYKAFEREYSATSNDPTKLLLNSPYKSIKYPVLRTSVKETTIAYDPTTLPQDAVDPWKLEGAGQFIVSGGLLTVIDDDFQSSADSKPPFFTHTSDIVTDSLVSAAFRVRVDNYQADGVFTGVGFGVSDGFNVAMVGFVRTEATNLSSSIAIANDVKAKFNAHLVQATVHGVNDTPDALTIVDARDLNSLILLLNALKLKYGAHIAKADPTFVTIDVHKNVDVVDMISAADAKDLSTAIALANDLRSKFDAHRTAVGVHFVDDSFHETPLTMQVGILTNTGAYEFQDSWEASAVDWTVLRTYRIHRDANGDAYLYTSGDVSPLASVPKNKLPSISDFSGKFDPVQQVFFGSISREATSSSTWNLVRANISPLNSNLLEDNKSVAFDGTKIPELDTVSPWITLGHGGTEYVYTGAPGGLLVDSTCSAQAAEIVAMGASSGAFRGYMRFEPMLAPSTTCAVEFAASVDFNTFSLDNRADGVFIDDGELSVHFAFLYFSPSPAQVTGSSSSFSINSSDKLFLNFDGSASVTVNFASTLVTAAAVAAVINATVGLSVASDDGGRVKMVYGLGASSYITIVGGSAAQKLGLTVGKYFGQDSSPEPRVSWFSDSLPDQSIVPWTRSGSESTQMIGAIHSPVMRATDTSLVDYVAFTMSNPTVVTGAISPSSDWKLDFRLSVSSYTAGEAVPATLPLLDLHFSGVLANVEEGPGGKNVELHCAVDASDVPYLNLVTFDAGMNYINSVAQYAFAWNDGKVHSFNIFTNKTADQLFVCADGVFLIPTAGTPTYTALSASAGSVPSVTFGSGGEPTSNVDLRTALSVVDWESVAVFRDSKVSDPLAYRNRYIGIYRGGNPALMSSWNVANVDWTYFTTYRIVRDPMSFVAVYLGGSDVPVLAISYDPVRLPPCSSSFLRQITNNRPVIAWGAMNPMEISRTRWQYFNYSMGKLTLTDRIVPPHQVLNQANVMASPDHSQTSTKHGHFGFTVYSGGTPEDDFMSDADTTAYTLLGERVPPVPMTQNLESRGGLVRSAVPASSISALDFMDYNGLLGEFEDDEVNTVSSSIGYLPSELALTWYVILIANNVASAYESHRVRHATAANVHILDDTSNVITSPAAVDLTSAIARLIDFKAVFNNHVASSTFHSPADTGDTLASPNPVDLDSCITLCNEIVSSYNNHLVQGFYHFVPAIPPYFDPYLVAEPPASDLFTCQLLLDSLRWCFIRHSANTYGLWHARPINYSFSLSYSLSFVVELANHLKVLYNQHVDVPSLHSYADTFNVVTQGNAGNLDSAILLANALRTGYNLHVAGQHIHYTTGLDSFPFSAILNPLPAAIQLANDILKAFNAHVLFTKSHVEQDFSNIVTLSIANDLASVIALTNAMKNAYNNHRTSVSRGSSVHVKNDIVNVISASDATDLDSATWILNNLNSVYDMHRTQDGVHGSAAFIRLEAPDRVLYEGMKFWMSSDGVENLVSPFSDDETLHVDAIRYQANKALVYDGTLLPEQATIVSVSTKPSSIVDGDTLILEIDHLPPKTVVFQALDTTLTDIINRINALIPGCASSVGTELRLSSSVSDPSSAVIVNGGTALSKLGLTIPHHSPWFVVSENPLDVSIAVMTGGTEEFLRYGVTGPSKTMYANMAGYTLSPSIGFDMSVRIRINSLNFLGPEDSGIYVGLSGSANTLGFTAAIGWGGHGSSRYVKLQDMNSGIIFDRIPFDWFDGAFHTYSLTYDETLQTLRLSIDA